MCRIYPLVAISKVKPITDEFDKTLNGNQFTRFEMIPDHKVILEEYIALRQRLVYLSENIGKRLSIDETYLSKRTLPILTNKAAERSYSGYGLPERQTVIAIIEKTPLKLRNTVSDII
jgi:hypothetical protein